MNAQQFLAEFSHIASAPSGLQRVRELVIYLAIHGELNTGGESNHQAAQQLITDAVEIKRKMRDARETRREQPLPTIPESHIAGYPNTWALTRLGSVVHLVSGQHLSAEDQNSNGLGIPYFTGASDFGPLHPVVTRWTNVSRAVAKEGDFLIAVKGTIGKINVLNLQQAALGRQLMAVRALAIAPAFLALILRSNENYFLSKRVGIAIPGISREDILHIIVGIPSRDEQERIVAKVDELMALCDKLEAEQHERERLRKHTRTAVIHALSNAHIVKDLSSAWRRLEQTMPLLFRQPSDVDDLRNLILDMAATGRLSESHRDDSKAEELIEEAKVSRLRRVAVGEIKRINMSSTEIKDVHIPIPSHWVSASIEELFRFIDYRGNTPVKTTSGRVLITAKNVRPGRIDANPLEYISETSYQEWMTRGWPQIGDLLITTEAPLGNVARIEEEPRFALAQRVINLQPYARINTKYFMYFMMSPSFQHLLWVNATGTTAKGIKAAKLRRLKLSVPPYEEQERIVQRTASLLTLCDQLEGQIERFQFIAGQLASACTAAITGIRTEDKEKMKAPKTELVSNLRIGISPTSREQAPLAAILVRHQGELSAKALWGSSGLEIDAFYQQLKTEVSNGWIVQPEAAYMKEVETA